jgi:hypothetical protein
MQARNCRCGAVWCEARRACSTSPNNWSQWRHYLADSVSVRVSCSEAVEAALRNLEAPWSWIPGSSDVRNPVRAAGADSEAPRSRDALRAQRRIILDYADQNLQVPDVADAPPTWGEL